MGAFIGLTHFVIVSGVEKGIERASKIMMPLLFLILLIMCVRSVTLPNAEAGLFFLFKPDFSKLTSSVVLSALGQAFFSLSLGMGCDHLLLLLRERYEYAGHRLAGDNH